MPLAPGTQLGVYVVEQAIGTGGMGEVYRARDTRLERSVALKVLPELFTSDPERLARFEREARVLASLNHPNIAHIHGLEDAPSTGSGQAGGIRALVLELVEGPTLADRIADGPMALDEALPIARQIVDALDYAHEQGIVHRDLKPANIKVRLDGTVKVLDFGLAKAMAANGSGSTPDAMNSPTLTARNTQVGVIIGTAAYMAPEQARGRPADRRSDIWAFGIVLFEMLTGRRPFDGENISVTLASVLKDDIAWSVLPPNLPASVRRLLRRCLEKDPKRRLSAIADARLELDEPDTHTSVISAPAPAVRTTSTWVPWTITAAATLAAMSMLWMWSPWREAVVTRPLRISGEVGAEGTLVTNLGAAAVISPDGQTVVFVLSNADGRSRLYVRRLDSLKAVLLEGTEDAMSPFFSPDGRSIAFFTPGKLKKIPVGGGAVETLCDAPGGRGGSWGADGTIVFQPTSASASLLHSVPAEGGTPIPIGATGRDVARRWPQILPSGRAVLYSGNTSGLAWDTGSIMAQPLPAGTPKVLVEGAFYGRYADGHLLYIRDGILFSAPFDVETLEVRGEAAPVIEGVLSAAYTGGAEFSVSDTGTLLYVPGTLTGDELPVTWIDSRGKATVLKAEPANWDSPSFSPDGRQLAMAIGYGAASDIWIYDWARGTGAQLTFGRGVDTSPVWTSDGSRIAYASTSDETSPNTNIYWKRTDGVGEPQRLTDSANTQIPFSFHPTGKYLAYNQRSQSTDVMILPLDGDEKTGWKPGTPIAFAATEAVETAPAFSPDGRWLAYSSTESGTTEIYVRPFPAGEGKWKVSTAPGGVNPRWSPRKQELFYTAPIAGQIAGQIAVMVVPYEVEGRTFRPSPPRRWYPELITSTRTARSFDVHPDGDRIAIAKPEMRADAGRLPVFVFNFFEELRRVRR